MFTEGKIRKKPLNRQSGTLLFFFVFAGILPSTLIHAGTPTVVISSPTFKSLKKDKGACISILREKKRQETFWQPYFENPRVMAQISYPTQVHPNSAADYPETVLKRWELERGFNNANGDLDRLRSKAASLDEDRTSYIGFTLSSEWDSPLDVSKDGSEFSGLRFFDGSTTPLFMGHENHVVLKTSRHLTFEQDLKETGFILPERTFEKLTGQPRYIFELGLLNVERTWSGGLQTLLSTLSIFLDSHYNNGLYNTRGQLHVINSLSPAIYISCKYKHTKIYGPVGFDFVYDLRTQKPLRTPTGLYIMKISASEIIRRYGEHSIMPHKKGEQEQVSHSTAAQSDSVDSGYDQWLTHLENTAPQIILEKDFKKELDKLNEIRKLYFHTENFKPDQSDAPGVKDLVELADQLGYTGWHRENFIKLGLYSKFFEFYYQLAYACLLRLPPKEKHKFETLIKFYRDALISTAPQDYYQLLLEKSENNEPLMLPFY
jgi:hypothetical protein